MTLKEEINKSNSILCVIPSENYNNILISTIKKILNNDKIGYVTLNKGYNAITNLFKKNKIKLVNFFFIDSITKTVKTVENNIKNCIFVSSPNSLTELTVAINKGVAKQKSKFIIFDSLSTLLIYHNDNLVSKFTQGLLNKFEATETNLIFTLTTKDKKTNLFKNLQMFIDKIIEL